MSKGKYTSCPVSSRAAAVHVIKVLRKHGYESLLAGGCVRDKLLGRRPKDYDVSTNAVPSEVVRLFRRTLTVGARFGVVVVLYGGRQIEVATFRSDDTYSDGRRPDKVVFTDAREDAARRDFTINGMFYDPVEQKVIDYVNGRQDLQAGIIRAIGDPWQRFREDRLRMLRAVRFATRLDFRIEPATFKAITALAETIVQISAERIAVELEQILIDPRRGRGMQMLQATGLLPYIFPEMSKTQVDMALAVLHELPVRCSFELALAAFMLACGPRTAEQQCRKLKTSNTVRKHVKWLVANYQALLEAIPMSKGKLKKWLAEPLFPSLQQLCRSYSRATHQYQDKLRQLTRQINDLSDEVISPPRLLDGHELIRLGAVPGPMVGQLSEELYIAQLEDTVKTPEQAREWVEKWLKTHSQPNPD